RARPRLLGALLDRLAGALRERDRVILDRLPRMADFAQLAVAAERGAGEEPRFLAAYAGARAEADEAAVEGSPVGPALLGWLAGRDLPWEGTAAELLAVLEGRVEERERPRGWPRTPRGLRAELDRIAPSLRRLGFALSSERRGHGGPRLLRIRPEEAGAQPSPPSPPSANGSLPAASLVTVGRDDRHQPSPTVTRPSPIENPPDLQERPTGDGGDAGDGPAAPSSGDGLPPQAWAVLEALRQAGEPLAVPEIARRVGIAWPSVRALLEGPLAGRVRSRWTGGVERFRVVEEEVRP
ncbi:MAG TPA: helix-turn-helix domain-containing protein, partial [Actinomycetota bacterium]|nr:helix-turn-helix domain-containing protein [Actinomycetota bacterium]